MGGIRAGAGRKTAKIDMVELEKLCALNASDEEIASWFGVSLRTLQKRRQQPKFAAVMRRGRAMCCMKVHNAQMRLVDKGNPTMVVWMGKTLLGQRETSSVRIALPKIKTSQDLSQAAGRVMQAAARGKITSAQGREMMSILESYSSIMVNVEGLSRLEKLEQSAAAAPAYGIRVVGLPDDERRNVVA